jgi:hypothetical protein
VLQLQGTRAKEVANILKTRFRVPSAYIEVGESKIKPKKKK